MISKLTSDMPPSTDYLAFAAYRVVMQDVQIYIRRLPQTVNAFSVGRTPALWAASCGHYDVMIMLEKYGGDLNSRTTDGQSALTCAVWGGKPRMVKDMLERGFDPAEQDKQGRTALDWAREMGRMDIVKVLEGPTVAAVERQRVAELTRRQKSLNALARQRKMTIGS